MLCPVYLSHLVQMSLKISVPDKLVENTLVDTRYSTGVEGAADETVKNAENKYSVLDSIGNSGCDSGVCG